MHGILHVTKDSAQNAKFGGPLPPVWAANACSTVKVTYFVVLRLIHYTSLHSFGH